MFGLICTHSFHVIFHLGSLGTNNFFTAPPAVPDSATKCTEATGGLRSVTPFEAPSTESPGVVLPMTQVDLCVCVICS